MQIQAMGVGPGGGCIGLELDLLKEKCSCYCVFLCFHVCNDASPISSLILPASEIKVRFVPGSGQGSDAGRPGQ